MQPGKTYRRVCFAWVKDADGKFCLLQPTIYNHTQFRHQLVFFVHAYGWLAEGCLWHLLPMQSLPSASFAWRHAFYNVITSRIQRRCFKSQVFYPYLPGQKNLQLKLKELCILFLKIIPLTMLPAAVPG